MAVVVVAVVLGVVSVCRCGKLEFEDLVFVFWATEEIGREVDEEEDKDVEERNGEEEDGEEMAELGAVRGVKGRFCASSLLDSRVVAVAATVVVVVKGRVVVVMLVPIVELAL